tara:strand:- start:2182 stop:3282 length:1101 start_codon:yes stop_codon:yes gene_type:complete
MFFANIYNNNNKLLESYYTLHNMDNLFIIFVLICILYTLADNYYFDLHNYRWFENVKNIIILYIFLISILVAFLPFSNVGFIKLLLVFIFTVTFCFVFSALITIQKDENTNQLESITNIASSDENNYDWIPFEQPDMPSMSLINEIKDKYNKDFTSYRNDFLLKNDECLFYKKHGKFPYNNNLLRPSYDHMKALDPGSTLSFKQWKDSYYKIAQQSVPMRVLILRSTSGDTGYELEGIKEVDFANSLYQGKLKLDDITTVGCKSDNSPYFKQNGIMDNTKSDTDIYDAINKVFDIDFLESSGSGCNKGRQLCTENNILTCPFRFQDKDKNTRMSDVMAKYWNMDIMQTKPFNAGCYSAEGCKEKTV